MTTKQQKIKNVICIYIYIYIDIICQRIKRKRSFFFMFIMCMLFGYIYIYHNNVIHSETVKVRGKPKLKRQLFKPERKEKKNQPNNYIIIFLLF